MPKNKNSTVKFLIFLLIFLIILLLLFIIFVIPSIKSYKSNSGELKQLEQNSIHLSAQEEELKKELAAFKIKNKNILKRSSSVFNVEDFSNFSKKYLQDVKITLIPNSSHTFAEYNLSAKTSQKSPKDFYKFLDALGEYKNIVKIDFPIRMISNRNNIVLNFHIEVLKNLKK